MPTSPAQEIAAILAARMGYAITVSRERTPEEICCGDPTNLDGNAHPWSEVGEDDRGIHYLCQVCGAQDVD